MNSLSSYLFQSHFSPNFSHPFFHSIWRSILTDFKANPHSPPNFHLSLSFSPLVCCFHITLSAWTFLKPTLSEHVSPCWTPWQAGQTGQPEVHHLPCTPQSPAFWIPRLLCWNCSPSSRMARRLVQGPFLRPVLVTGLQQWMAWTVHLCWVCFIPLPPSTSTSLGIPALSPLITFLWPDHV